MITIPTLSQEFENKNWAGKIFVGGGARTRYLVLHFMQERLFCLALFWYSQRYGKAALW